MKPKYDWLPSGLGRANDYSGWDEDICFGRFYQHHHGYWRWFLNGIGLGSADGLTDEPREAALQLEAAYDRVKALLVAQGHFDRVPRRPRGS